jgi:hypothetical protein
VNDKTVNNTDDLQKAIAGKSTITISGFYPGYDGVYEYPVSLDEGGE